MTHHVYAYVMCRWLKGFKFMFTLSVPFFSPSSLCVHVPGNAHCACVFVWLSDCDALLSHGITVYCPLQLVKHIKLASLYGGNALYKSCFYYYDYYYYFSCMFWYIKYKWRVLSLACECLIMTLCCASVMQHDALRLMRNVMQPLFNICRSLQTTFSFCHRTQSPTASVVTLTSQRQRQPPLTETSTTGAIQEIKKKRTKILSELLT